MSKPVELTVSYPVFLSQREIVLGLKKTRKDQQVYSGPGLFNGFGGHIEPVESFAAAALRELRQESGLIGEQAVPCGELLKFNISGGKPRLLHFFLVFDPAGELVASDEMSPERFVLKSVESLPWDRMWPSDRWFLPLILTGYVISGRMVVDEQDQVLTQRSRLNVAGRLPSRYRLLAS